MAATILLLPVLACSLSDPAAPAVTVAAEANTTPAAETSLAGGSSALPPQEHATAFAPSAAPVTLTLKVLSFNVYWGAGLEARFDENVSPRFRQWDRTPVLIDFLHHAGADVIAIQEAAGWDAGFAERLASELGMSYVLAPDAWELHVVLFSRHPIVSAEYVSRLQGFNGVALRATLAVNESAPVNVMAVHLNSMSRQTRTCQVEALLDMAGELPGRTILLGDMNFRPDAPQAAMLEGAGWQLLRAQERWPIDQIWLDSRGDSTAGQWWEGLEEPERISDHWPVGADITLDVPSVSGAMPPQPVFEPGPLDYACALP